MNFLTLLARDTTSRAPQNHHSNHLHLHKVRDSVDGNLPFQPPEPASTGLSNSTFSKPAANANGTSPHGPATYYSGLAGVNLVMDARLVRLLWLSIIVALVVVFALRLAQLFVSYIRKIYCMNTRMSSQQKYYTLDHAAIWPWLKKNLIYAPLWKKRHNREFQMSRAVNYGTLPGRIHTLLLVIYGVTNVTYCLLLDWSTPKKGALYAELRGRSGILATVNLIPLVVLAQRNNIAIPFLKVSFDTFNLFHRWLGRLVAMLSLIHFFAWLAAYVDAKGKHATMKIFHQSAFLSWGMVGLVVMIILPLHSLSPIRHAFYEVFLHLHQTLAFFALLGVYVHLSMKHLPAYPSILTAVLLLMWERLWRLARLLYLNFSRKGGISTAHVEALPGEACRVTFQLPRHITIRPGSHVYAYLPAISLWMSHPFSVAWTNVESEPSLRDADGKDARAHTPDSLENQTTTRHHHALSRAATSVSLIMAARTGMTRKLYDAARQSPSGKINLRGFLEGPYAGHDSLESYGTVVMFAGGAGITHHLIQIRHLLAGAQAQTVATRKMVLVWSIRDTDAMEWVKPWMTEILHMEGRREVLKILVYVSKPSRAINQKKSRPTMQIIKGRADPRAVLDEVIPVRVGAVMVSVCGPGALADEVRDAVRRRIYVANLELNEESFTW